MAWENCVNEIIEAGGGKLSEQDIEAILSEIARRAERNKSARLSPAEKIQEAAAKMAMDVREAATVLKRNELMNARKRAARRAFYQSAPTPQLGVEAKLTGVNTPFEGNRLSTWAQYDALQRDYLAGMALDLEREGLGSLWRSGQLDDRWAAELFDLNRPGGKGGVTGDANALKIAQLVRKWQRVAVEGLNREGAWIRDYAGYLARSTHDADRIRRAGSAQWQQDLLSPAFDVDIERTFGSVEAATRALPELWMDFATGNHVRFDDDLTDAAIPGMNVAKKASASREIHFRSAAGWMAYNAKYGTGNLRQTVVGSLDQAARWTALMREFGTNPRAAFEADLQWVEDHWRHQPERVARFQRRRHALQIRFDYLDGTADMPVNRLTAQITSGWMALQRMAKLGSAPLSALSDVATKAAELRYQGVGLLERWSSSITAYAQGRGAVGSERREVLDLLRAGTDGVVGRIAGRFDRIDTPTGTLATLENMFHRLTGLTAMTDRQRMDAEFIMARHLGTRKNRQWAGLEPEVQRILRSFRIGPQEWDLLRSVDWKQVNGRNYLTPERARLIDDATVEAILRQEGRLRDDAGSATVQAEIRRYKEDLALKVHAYYSDRGTYAVLEAGARERAILLQGARPGSPLGIAMRLFAQFKSFPVAMITRAWGREVHGGQGRMGAAAGIVQLLVASTVLGYVNMMTRDLLKGRNPRDPSDPRTWLQAFVAGGGASLYGDFAFGEFSRFGRSALASLAGPTLGQIDDIMELVGRVRRGEDPWAQGFRFALSNTPGQNIWWSRWAVDYLLLYQIQEALSPGYLRRMERRVQRENDQTFWLRPSEVVR